jgi:hypothetical protein
MTGRSANGWSATLPPSKHRCPRAPVSERFFRRAFSSSSSSLGFRGGIPTMVTRLNQLETFSGFLGQKPQESAPMRKIERISIVAADRERLDRLIRDRNTPQKVV